MNETRKPAVEEPVYVPPRIPVEEKLISKTGYFIEFMLFWTLMVMILVPRIKYWTSFNQFVSDVTAHVVIAVMSLYLLAIIAWAGISGKIPVDVFGRIASLLFLLLLLFSFYFFKPGSSKALILYSWPAGKLIPVYLMYLNLLLIFMVVVQNWPLKLKIPVVMLPVFPLGQVAFIALKGTDYVQIVAGEIAVDWYALYLKPFYFLTNVLLPLASIVLILKLPVNIFKFRWRTLFRDFFSVISMVVVFLNAQYIQFVNDVPSYSHDFIAKHEFFKDTSFAPWVKSDYDPSRTATIDDVLGHEGSVEVTLEKISEGEAIQHETFEVQLTGTGGVGSIKIRASYQGDIKKGGKVKCILKDSKGQQFSIKKNWEATTEFEFIRVPFGRYRVSLVTPGYRKQDFDVELNGENPNLVMDVGVTER